MCGINGFTWKDAAMIEKMNYALRHRGPDDQSTYVDDKISLGHRRLSIIDLSPAGKQPMANEDYTVWVVFNGEIYNFSDIKKDLKDLGHEFRSNSDTEVIIHAYEQWGQSCVERFNGMWAFAIYDKAKGCLLLSRDRFGVKPLYYHCSEEGLIFSSEIKGLLQHQIKRSPNDNVVYEYLAFGLLDHKRETFFEGIYRLMPGENLVYDLSRKTMETSKWYDLESRLREREASSEEDLIKEVRSLFEDAVRYRLIADVPIGSCLSGGLDSSSIVHVMRKLVKDDRIKTFSMVFPGQKLDESSYIDEVIRRTGVEPHKVTPTAEDLMRDLSDLVWTQEEPFRSISIYGQYRVMELAHKSNMKVLLDGQGADELFAGYFIYYKYYLIECLLKLRLEEYLKVVKVSRASKSDLLVFPLASILSKSGFASSLLTRAWKNRTKYLNDDYNGECINPLFEKGLDLNRALFCDFQKYSLPQLLRYEDKNSMRWAIESRVPFLDYRLVELVSSLQSRYKMKNGITKYIFKRAVEDLVPEKIIRRKDKIGFATPDSVWLHNSAFSDLMRDMIGSEKFRQRKYWKYQEVSKLFDEHSSGTEDHSEDLWKVINVELWLRKFIDG